MTDETEHDPVQPVEETPAVANGVKARLAKYAERAEREKARRQLAESELAEQVMGEGRSGMNYDRFYTLWQALLATGADDAAVEIGAYRGGSAKFIGEAMKRAGRLGRFYVCDTFSGHPRIDPTVDGARNDGNYFQHTSAADVAAYLAPLENVELVVGDIIETSERLADERFGFVHVDVDLYEATSYCLRFFGSRLALKGLIVVDDYGVKTCPGAQKAVDEFTAEANGFRAFHLLTGQALLFRD